MRSAPRATTGWGRYVEQFHAGRAGVTEALLGCSVDDEDLTAYDWITEALPDGLVVDVGCGSGSSWATESRGKYVKPSTTTTSSLSASTAPFQIARAMTGSLRSGFARTAASRGGRKWSCPLRWRDGG
jgi:hypothetical protein